MCVFNEYEFYQQNFLNFLFCYLDFQNWKLATLETIPSESSVQRGSTEPDTLAQNRKVFPQTFMNFSVYFFSLTTKEMTTTERQNKDDYTENNAFLFSLHQIQHRRVSSVQSL